MYIYITLYNYPVASGIDKTYNYRTALYYDPS